MLETKQKYCRCLQIHQHGGTQKQTCSEGERKKLFQTFNSQKENIIASEEDTAIRKFDWLCTWTDSFWETHEIATSWRRSPGSTSRGADLHVKRGYAFGSRKRVYRGCRSPSHLNRHAQQTQETAQTNSTWPAFVHSSKTRWSPRMVWSRYLHAQRRKRIWKKRDDLGTHEKLFTQVQSNTGWVGDQRRSQRIGNGPELGPDLSEDVRRGRLLHYTHITREEKPEDEQMSTEDNVPDVRHGRPDGQPEPKRSGKRQGSVVEPSQPSLSVSGPGEERMTTANASTDVEEPYRGERRVRTRDNQTPPQPKTLTPPLTMPQNKKNRARVAKYLGSMKAATGETMSLDVVATYWKWVPRGKKNNNRGRRRRKPTTYRATRSMGPFKKKSTSDT